MKVVCSRRSRPRRYQWSDQLMFQSNSNQVESPSLYFFFSPPFPIPDVGLGNSNRNKESGGRTGHLCLGGQPCQSGWEPTCPEYQLLDLSILQSIPFPPHFPPKPFNQEHKQIWYSVYLKDKYLIRNHCIFTESHHHEKDTKLSTKQNKKTNRTYI